MSTENPTPDIDLDDFYIKDYALKVEDPTEVLMRGDFAHAQELLDNMPHAETHAEIDQLGAEAGEISGRWTGRTDGREQDWAYLSDAHDDWTRSPQTMARLHEQIRIDQAAGVHGLTEVQWRSQQQAREMTGHGSWTAPTVEAGRDPIPGHAFAGLVNTHDREQEGMDR